MISIAICGDEVDTLLIEDIVTDYLSIQKMPCDIYYFSSGSGVLSSGRTFDVIFLVVSGMQDIMTGKTIYKKNKNIKIICITNFWQYLEQAVNEMHAFACLVKPVIREKLAAQLSDILHTICQENESNDILKFKVLEISDGYKIESKIMDFNVRDIYYFEYTNRKVHMRLDNKSYFFYDTMNNLRDRMQAYNFYYCHQSYLVNMKYVTDIKGYDICLCNNEVIPLAQKRSVDFRKKFSSFVYHCS